MVHNSKNLKKWIASFVIAVFCLQMNLMSWPQRENDIIKQFQKAKNMFLSGEYLDSKKRIEVIIDIIDEKRVEMNTVLGKCYLLLGAIYERENNPQLAEENYRKAREIYETIFLEDVEMKDLPIYQKIMKGEGLSLSDTGGKIEQVVVKRKKKFPWLWVAGGVVVAVGVTILLLNKKKSHYDTDVLGIQWIDIPRGEFLMGDNFNDGEGEINEQPVHTVFLDAYKISKFEVTFQQYDTFCEATGRNKPDDKGWGRGDRPVIFVTWDDAKAFCDWLSRETGNNIHLPTEAQWEKAARGTDRRKYPWGNTAPSCDLTNYDLCLSHTMPVGSYPGGVSPYGAYDMAGNVWEWCSDWYDAGYYSISPGHNPTGPAAGVDRVNRGGAYTSLYTQLRCSNRNSALPSKFMNHLGFRICWD
jgi:formylglycine-generating enzyme required for sulfatase activity